MAATTRETARKRKVVEVVMAVALVCAPGMEAGCDPVFRREHLRDDVAARRFGKGGGSGAWRRRWRAPWRPRHA